MFFTMLFSQQLAACSSLLCTCDYCVGVLILYCVVLSFNSLIVLLAVPPIIIPTYSVGLFAMGKCRRQRETLAETDVRKEYLELHLKTHKVVAATSEDASDIQNKNNNGEELDPEAATPFMNISNIHKGDLILALPPPVMTGSQKEESDLNDIEDEDDDDDDRPMCAICVVAYEAGDVICWSKNDQCHHCFHKECIQQWLLLHEDCPCCRLPFLVVVVPQNNKGEGNDNGIRIVDKAEEEEEEGGC